MDQTWDHYGDMFNYMLSVSKQFIQADQTWDHYGDMFNDIFSVSKQFIQQW